MKSYLLRGARVALGAHAAEILDAEVRGASIRAAPRIEPRPGATVLNLEGHLLLPGLVNAHDHLEFNLFPRLGRGPYANATAWARDIYHPDESPVREQRAVPRPVRLFWGGLKNLLSGATTVWHHNPADPSLYSGRFPVRVVRRCGWAHSLAFSTDLADRFRATRRTRPFVVHAAEGIDECARAEVFRLDEMGCLDARTVLVHGVGLDEPGLALVRARGASLVWCPSSNLFLFGRTLDAAALALAGGLGSDSALTAAGDLLDEIRIAAGLADPGRVYALVARAAHDLIAISDPGGTPADALACAPAPVLVFIGGRMRLAAPHLLPNARGWSRIELEGRPPVLVPFDLRPLLESTVSALGPHFRLCGRAVTSGPSTRASE